MARFFTPASERALDAAAAWSSCADCDELQAPEVLLGLLAEAECRAAEMLAARGVNVEAVCRRWPTLQPAQTPPAARRRPFSAELAHALDTAEARLWEYPRPLTLATEHLLLGLVAAPGETSAWLADFGFEAQELEQTIHRLYGHDPGPLPLDVGATIPDSTSVAGSPIQEAARLDGPPPAAAPRATSDETGLLRVIDAAANRAREGLRVVEDYVRFVLDDGHLTAELKRLRHDLRAALDRWPAAALLASRDTQADVGTTLATAAEGERTGAGGVLAANFKRAQEACRSLEEFAKTFDPAVAATIEQLRYRAYTLERAVATTRRNCQRLAAARLYVLLDGASSVAQFERLVGELVTAGVDVIQLRDKQLSDRELLARGRLLARLTRGTAAVAIVNDRPDLAALCDADGVHLGQDDLAVKDARAILGPDKLVGVSTHSVAQARQAVLDGADYLGVGPTFDSSTKRFEALAGVELLRAVAAEIRLPAFAIGGISLDNLAAVQATGMSRVAVSAAIARAADPAAAAAEFARRLREDPRSAAAP